LAFLDEGALVVEGRVRPSSHGLESSTGLTRRQFWAVLATALAVFAVGAGPVWRDPWTIDRSIYLSYAVIPPMVLATLLVSRRFTWRDFALDTITMTSAKFGVTYVVATVLWAVSGEPPPLPPRPPWRFAPAPVTPPPPPVAPAEAVALEGVVTAAGAPRGGVVVWVAQGVEEFTYAQRADVVDVVDDGGGFVPPVAAVQAGAPLRLRSGDGRLHAIRATNTAGQTVFNVAATSSSTVVRVREAAGVVTLSCAVRDHAEKEQPGTLVVLAHPFFATTGADGRFGFEGLPRGRVLLRALHPDLGEAQATMSLPSARPVALPLVRRRAPDRAPRVAPED
jgi:hypothetical protein